MVAVNFLWNPLNDNIVREFDDAGSAVAEYTTEPEEFGNVVSQRRDGVDSYFHFDGMGSTLALSNQGGATTDTQSYDAFGGTREEAGATVFPFRFGGRNCCYSAENELDVIAIRRRQYDCDKGRWQSRDVRRSLGEAPYVYSYNRPVTYQDVSGEFPELPPVEWPRLPRPVRTIVVPHGRYCALGNPAFWDFNPCRDTHIPKEYPREIPRPRDDLDQLCLVHDCCLYPAKRFVSPSAQCTCNLNFCVAVFNPKLCDDSPIRASCERKRADIMATCTFSDLPRIPVPGIG
jgi:RHS repeat-associated protein